MTWANFGILGVGGLLVSVPIILHFLFQPKPISVDFPALRFLKQKQQTTRSRLKLKHFALLLIRCLLIALIALALAGPSVASSDFGNWLTLGGVGISGLIIGLIGLIAYFRPTKNWLLIGVLAAALLGHLIFGGVSVGRLMTSDAPNLIGDSQAPVAALIVVDSSPRMQLEFENETRLDKAKSFGKWLLTQFPRDSQVCVVATDGDSPYFSVDVGAADRRMTKLETNYTGAKIPSAVEQGLETLKTSPHERKEIYILTDLTAESWTGDGSKKLTRMLKQSPELSLFVVDVGVDSPNNFSLGQIRLSAVEISADGRFSVQTETSNAGPAAQRTIKMQVEKIDASRPVERDGQVLFSDEAFAAQSVVVDVRENGSAPIKFDFNRSLQPGTYHGAVSIQGKDGLAIDDRRYFTFRVSKARSTLVVHPENVNPQIMLSMLAPREAVEDGSNRFEYRVASQADFSSLENLKPFDAIFVLDPKPMPDAVWQRLSAYVDGGGGVGLFLGQNANDNGVAHPSFLSDDAKRVIGGVLDQQWFNETDDLFLSPKELSHPIFNPIQGSETAVLWNRFPIFKHWGLVPDAQSDLDEANQSLPTQTLLRYSNREPAVVERTIGSGRVLTMTTPITEYGYTPGRQRWNLLIRPRPVPLFLLLKGIVSHLVQSDAESLNVQVGQVSTLKNDLSQFPDSYKVFSPNPDKPASNLNSVEGQIRFRFNDMPGHYRFRGVLDQQVVLRGFSSNLPESTTNLTRIGQDELDDKLGAGRYQLATERNEIQRQQGTMRRGQELYPFIVIMMLIMLGIEFLMANRFYG
jgi:hypothetical protein